VVNSCQNDRSQPTCGSAFGLVAYNWRENTDRYRRVSRFVEHLFGRVDKLQAAGFDPFVVDRGELGIARLRYENPDVCVLDLMLPGVDGVEVCRRLEHAEVIAIDAAMQPLFRDVTDHVLRVQEEIDSLREVLAFAFEASLMTGQAQQTAITRKLAAWAAILAVPTAIAGIYGMNFEHMPELKWRYGYFIVIAIIAAICGSLYWRFHRNNWL
jgi:CheY-like chemotaxis protein